MGLKFVEKHERTSKASACNSCVSSHPTVRSGSLTHLSVSGSLNSLLMHSCLLLLRSPAPPRPSPTGPPALVLNAPGSLTLARGSPSSEVVLKLLLSSPVTELPAPLEAPGETVHSGKLSLMPGSAKAVGADAWGTRVCAVVP